MHGFINASDAERTHVVGARVYMCAVVVGTRPEHNVQKGSYCRRISSYACQRAILGDELNGGKWQAAPQRREVITGRRTADQNDEAGRAVVTGQV